MGWSGGTEVAEGVWKAIEPLLDGRSEKEVEAVAEALVEVFEAADCDTLDEVEGPIGRVARRKLEPDLPL